MFYIFFSTQTFPKIPKDVRKCLKMAENFQRHRKSSEDKVIKKMPQPHGANTLVGQLITSALHHDISHSQSQDVYRRDFAPSAFHFKNQRLRGKYHHLFILHIVFTSYIGLSLHIFGNCVKQGDNTSHNQSGVRIWAASVSQREIEVFNPQAWDSHLRRESWQVYESWQPIIGFLILFVEIASKLEKVVPTISNFNPFLSLPSVATNDRKQNKRHNIVLNNKPRPLVLEFS